MGVPTYTKTRIQTDRKRKKLRSVKDQRIKKKLTKVVWAENSCDAVPDSTKENGRQEKNKRNGMTKTTNWQNRIQVDTLPVSLLTSNTDISCWKNAQHSTVFTTKSFTNMFYFTVQRMDIVGCFTCKIFVQAISIDSFDWVTDNNISQSTEKIQMTTSGVWRLC